MIPPPAQGGVAGTVSEPALERWPHRLEVWVCIASSMSFGNLRLTTISDTPAPLLTFFFFFHLLFKQRDRFPNIF